MIATGTQVRSTTTGTVRVVADSIVETRTRAIFTERVQVLGLLPVGATDDGFYAWEDADYWTPVAG